LGIFGAAETAVHAAFRKDLKAYNLGECAERSPSG
jgi:hypothetical protein